MVVVPPPRFSWVSSFLVSFHSYISTVRATATWPAKAIPTSEFLDRRLCRRLAGEVDELAVIRRKRVPRRWASTTWLAASLRPTMA